MQQHVPHETRHRAMSSRFSAPPEAAMPRARPSATHCAHVADRPEAVGGGILQAPKIAATFSPKLSGNVLRPSNRSTPPSLPISQYEAKFHFKSPPAVELFKNL